MNWFKHDASATQDAKLKKLIIRHGAVGYAIYFHCLELIAGDLSETNITFQLEHDSEIIADDLRITGSAEKSGVDIVEEVMRYIVSLGLFENNNNIITCMSMARRLDLSMTNNATMRKMISEVRDINTGFVYIIKSQYGCKIGKTKNYTGRLALFGVKLPFDFDIEVVVKIKKYYEVEAELHRMYASKLVSGEWYSIDHIDIEYIKNYMISSGGELVGLGSVMTCHDRGDKKEEKREEEQDKQAEETADKPPRVSKTSEPRKQYGAEKNVLLTDTQYSNLLADLGDAKLALCIETLSTAKAMKGYVYKRDDLAIRKWVIKAVEERGTSGDVAKYKQNPGGMPDHPYTPTFGKH